MTEPNQHNDDALFGALAAASAPTLSPRRAAAQRARLAKALDGEHRALRRRLSPALAAALVVVAAGGAAATVATVTARPSTPPPAVIAPAVAASTTTATRNDDPDVPLHETVVDTVVVADAPAGDADVVPSPKKRPRRPAAESIDEVGTLVGRIARGDDVAAAVRALGRRGADDGVRAALVSAIDDADDAAALARLRRAQCEIELRYGRTALALSACRNYARAHPDDDGARPLSFGAGGLAEELGLLMEAVDHYTRAIVLSPLSGSSSADALKARARVHARAGALEEARADLSVFLRLRPGAALDDDVRGLATSLGVDLRQ